MGMTTTTILTSLITALTSIIVALITAGYLKKFLDSKKEQKSRKELANQLEKNEIINFSLKEIKRKYDADRVTIMQFHNGGHFYTNSSIQKSSMTYEILTNGLEPIAQKYQNLLISNFSWYFNQVINNKGFFYSIYDDIPDLATKSIIQSYGTNSHVAVPIFDKDKNLIGTLGLDWAFTEVPTKISNQNNFNEDFKNNISIEAQSLLNYL